MAVRNFWIDASIDGRKTELAGGPASKEGGMNVVIKQRSNGGIVKAAVINCYEVDGNLVTDIVNNDGELVATFETKR